MYELAANITILLLWWYEVGGVVFVRVEGFVEGVWF